MNKSKLPMPARTRKKMDKQVKKDIQSASLETASTVSHDTSITQLLSRLPSKMKKKKENVLKAFEKTFELKKKKGSQKISKRTNTGVQEHSSPSNAHTEGKRWMKVANKQTRANSKIFNKATLKKK